MIARNAKGISQMHCGFKTILRRQGVCGVLTGVFLAASSMSAQTQPQSDRRKLLEQFSQSLDELTARVSPAIVQVLVTGYGPLEDKNKGEASQIGRQRSLGSGVILDSDGYIITNAHVVKGAQRVRVVITPRSASESQLRTSLGSGEHLPPLTAKIIGIAPSMDLAVLKIEAKGLPTLPFADYTKLRKGQLVLAFGNPEGLENTVTMGVVSAVARQPDPDSPNVYIQTDAPINPGNSGGPLVDAHGQLVGINTFILTESGGSQGLGFAIPSSAVQFVYEQLRKFGRVHRSIIGVQLQEITPDLASALRLKKQEGVIVSDVLPGAPAEKAGMKIQDILLAIDGRGIGSVPIADMIISTKPTGTIVRAQVLRGAEEKMVEITVTEQKSDADHLADLVDPEKSLVAKLGIFGIEIDTKLAEDLEDLRIPSGVIVAASSADANGADADLHPGDVIHAVNGRPIETLEGLRAALSAIPASGSGALQIERDGRLMYVTFEMD
jgi:serine protease Do